MSSLTKRRGAVSVVETRSDEELTNFKIKNKRRSRLYQPYFIDLYCCERFRPGSSNRPTGMKIRNRRSEARTLSGVQPSAR